MRFLKTKILRAQQALKKQDIEPLISPLDTHSKTKPIFTIKKRIPLPKTPPQKVAEYNRTHSRRSLNSAPEIPVVKVDDCSKNIIINYGKAITTFAASELAVP